MFKSCDCYFRTEKNATPWSKDRIKQLLCQIEIEKGAVTIKLTEVQKLEGEATANNRKAKLIFLFEWDIKVKLTGLYVMCSNIYLLH
jgi:activator of HSP90 ATPase